MPIIKIALDNGFPNLKSFHKAFKDVYRTTPAEYRKQRGPAPDTKNMPRQAGTSYLAYDHNNAFVSLFKYLPVRADGQSAAAHRQSVVVKQYDIRLSGLGTFCQQIESSNFMKENNVQIESWAPFAEGRNNIFQNEVLVSVAEKYNKSVAQVILRWLTQRGVVVIPKSVQKERIIEKLDTKKSLFFSHNDPEIVKWIGTRKIDIYISCRYNRRLA